MKNKVKSFALFLSGSLFFFIPFLAGGGYELFFLGLLPSIIWFVVCAKMEFKDKESQPILFDELDQLFEDYPDGCILMGSNILRTAQEDGILEQRGITARTTVDQIDVYDKFINLSTEPCIVLFWKKL